MKTLYTAHATSVGGRSGHVDTDDKRLSFTLTPSNSSTGTNPEQLFACGYAACFGSALDAVARKEKLEVGQITVKIDVDLNQDEKGGFYLSATLDVYLPGFDKDQAARIVQKAHHVCPYSKATSGNIDVTLKLGGHIIPKTS